MEEQDQRKITYFIFTAHHGLTMGKHGVLGKQSLLITVWLGRLS
ncbi:hypothetical protein [Echinicola sediminis]